MGWSKQKQLQQKMCRNYGMGSCRQTLEVEKVQVSDCGVVAVGARVMEGISHLAVVELSHPVYDLLLRDAPL